MTNEQLLFHACDAAQQAQAVTQELWDNKRPLDARTATHLKEQARKLFCAAVEIESRANGNKPPREG